MPRPRIATASESYARALELGGVSPVPAPWTFWADYADARYPWDVNDQPGGPRRVYTEPIGPVACLGFSCSWQLSGYGKGEAVIAVEEGSLAREMLLRFYGWRLWVMYGESVVWAGLPTDLTDEGSAAVTVALTELIGYNERKQYAMRRRYDQVEQTIIARDLAARLENVAVPIVIDPGPGFLRDRSYEYLEGESRGELLSNLTQVIGGPQFRAEYAMTPEGRPGCVLKIAYPRVGRVNSGLALNVPGGATNFSAHWSSAMMRTRTFSVGELPEDAPEGAERPVETVFRPQTGIRPNIDYVDDWPSVILRLTLRERALTNATIYAGPSVELTAAVPITDPPIDSYGVGDDVAISLVDAFMPEGYPATGSLDNVEINAGDGTAAWTVVITDPAPLPLTLGSQIRQVEAQARGLRRRNIESPGVDET